MPRKRKSLSLSPQKRSSNPSIPVALSSSATLPLPATMSRNKKEMLSSMCDMFPNLEPSLVEMVLSEYTEVEIVMDYLLELSTVAKGEAQLESTGFENITAYLDGSHIDSQSPENEDAVPDKEEDYLDDQCNDETTCNDLDMLLDEALDRYGLTNAEDIYSAEQPENSVSEASTSGIMSQPVQYASPGKTSFHTKYIENISQPQMSLGSAKELHLSDSPNKSNAVTICTTSSVQPETEREMIEAGFKTSPGTNDLYSQNDKIVTSSSQEHFSSSGTSAVPKPGKENSPSVLTAQSNVPSVSPKSQIKWNPMASAFFPASSQQGPFITPVVANPVQWPYAAVRHPSGIVSYNAQMPSAYVWNPFPQTHWTAGNVKPVSVPKPKPQLIAQIPKKMTRLVGKVLILLRGAPGSGKSTLARTILEQNPTGVSLSTDDYFCQNGPYQFDVTFLSEAHEWNQKRAKDAFEKNVSPIIIDNTNLQGWEMKPYVAMAMKYKYKVTFCEPDTWWRYKPKELERRNIHGVKREKIVKMLENFERVSVNSILNLSKKPESSAISQLKSAEGNGPSNNLVKEDDLCTTQAKIPSDTEVVAASADKSLVSHKAGNDPESALNLLESGKEYLKNTNEELQTYSDNAQYLDDISVEDQPYSVKHGSTKICVQEVITDEEVNSDIYGISSQMGEGQEPPSFVGDWPVEQTLSQRAPRNRKKAKSKCLSVQQLAEEEKTVDCNLEQEVVNPEPVLNEEFANSENNFETKASDFNETDLLKIEKPLHTIPAYINNENKSLEEHLADAPGVTSSEALQKDPPIAVDDINLDISSVIENVEKMTTSSKRGCKKCKLALTFSNNCSSSFGTDGTVSPCNLVEAVDQSSSVFNTCTQTEAHEFAIAWRVENRNMEVFESFKVLTGKADRFKSQSLETNENSQENIPYRMMHHKSTLVEEDEIISLQEEDSLQILCKLFRSLSFDVLKDLFEKCNKDLGWTTNLLLDSGEKIYKDECDQEELLKSEEENCEHLQNQGHLEEDSMYPDCSLPPNSEVTKEPAAYLELNDSSSQDSNDLALGNSALINNVSLVVAEELKNGNVLSSSEVTGITNQCIILNSVQTNQETVPDTIEAHIMWSSSLEGGQFNSQDPSLNMNIETNNILNDKTIKKESIQELNSPNDEVLYETGHSQRDIPTDEVNKDQENTNVLPVIIDKPQNNSKEPLTFDYLELSLPPEFAFQLTELFGPVGIDPGSLTIDDCLVPIDLKLAEAIHKKWKQSIMERHNQEALSYQLLLEDFSTNDHIHLDSLLQEQESRLAAHNLVVSQGENDIFPFMDQWNTRTKKVSLRQIMSEEMALQARQDLKKPLASSNCAVKMKEKQLLEMFPNLEQNLLMDIFKENNYSLEKTEQFISSALESDPVQNVVAPGFKQEVPPSTERTKEKRAKADKEDLSEHYFQDVECPEYDDFRAEALLYHKKQQESYKKAAEAHNRGMKQVAAFYAQQGYLYGQKMKEENHRAAVQIFERANEFLLPENILDLHGLHVDEAMKHFRRVLQEKTEDYRQNGGSQHLLVITGRGNRSHGGVPRIKPAVIDYLTNHDYRFQEKTPGALRITLK